MNIPYGEQLNRTQAISFLGLKLIKEIDNINCDFTNRVMEDDDLVELVAQIELKNGDTLEAYYYQDAKEVQDCDDLSNLDWVIDHYKIN